MDITTTEVADYIVGGVMACDASRFDAILEKKIPLVLSIGALDMVNFGPKVTVPSKFQQRRMYEHNEQVIVLLHSVTVHDIFWTMDVVKTIYDRSKN